MALKQLKLQLALREKSVELAGLMQRQIQRDTRIETLRASLEEASTPDDLAAITQELESIEKESDAETLADTIANVQAEIDRITGELEDTESRAQSAKSTKTTTKNEKRGNENMNRYQTRELLKTGEYYERSEVKEFYEKFRNIRAVGGSELTIPELVVNRILDILGDYSTIYPLVDRIKVNGTTRILIDTDTTAATWIEQAGALPESDVGTVTDISFDGYKIGKVTFIDNCMMQDSIVNLDDYVTKKIARAIALGLDLSVVKGSGNKQPMGIIPSLENDHKVTVKDGKLVDIVKPIAKVDTGKDSVGEIIAVMKRSTYYNRLLAYSINTNSAGDVVGKLPNLKAPDLLGLRVVFNNNMDDDTILYGDFSKYTLVERESIVIDKSEHVRFTQDQTGFRGKGRFDGKPTDKNAFVLVTITDAANPG